MNAAADRRFFKTAARHLETWRALWNTMREREAELDAIDASLADPACTDEQREMHLHRLAAIAGDETLHRRAARLQSRMLKHLQSEDCSEILRQIEMLAAQEVRT